MTIAATLSMVDLPLVPVGICCLDIVPQNDRRLFRVLHRDAYAAAVAYHRGMAVSPRALAVGVGLVSTVIAAIPALANAAGESVNRVVIEGIVKRGEEFARDFGSGFIFRLSGKDVWAIGITHASSPDKDLIYPVNPPYRFSNRLYVGPGYGESARDSVGNTPRELAFIYRPDDVGRAWNDLDKILWPYAHADAETEKALDELAQIPTGTVTFEILSADMGPDENRPGADEHVRWLRFRATITWPPASR